MNTITSFSHDSEWKCLQELIQTYPFNMQAKIRSKLIVEGVELLSKLKAGKNTISLDDFKNSEASPNVDLDKATWRKLCKTQEIAKLKKLEAKLIGRLSIVKTSLYERTL